MFVLYHGVVGQEVGERGKIGRENVKNERKGGREPEKWTKSENENRWKKEGGQRK